jgi:ribosome-binding factor A
VKRRRPSTARDYPRTARLNQLVQEIVAEELELLDDERLGFLTITAVEVAADLSHAKVYYSAFVDDEEANEVAVALGEHRIRLQGAVGRQARMRRTPELTFEFDEVVRGAARVEDIIRRINTDDD